MVLNRLSVGVGWIRSEPMKCWLRDAWSCSNCWWEAKRTSGVSKSLANPLKSVSVITQGIKTVVPLEGCVDKDFSAYIFQRPWDLSAMVFTSRFHFPFSSGVNPWEELRCGCVGCASEVFVFFEWVGGCLRGSHVFTDLKCFFWDIFMLPCQYYVMYDLISLRIGLWS